MAQVLPDQLDSTRSKGMTMKNIRKLALLVAAPALLAGCDQYVTDMGYGDARQARLATQWNARDMAVSGYGTKKCDGYDYAIDSTVPPEGEPDYGCSLAYNRARMAERREDLVQGRELSNVDSARSDLVTEYYRQDKTKALLKLEKIFGQ